jgi:hypothetical protein
MDRESAEEIGRARFLFDGIGLFFYSFYTPSACCGEQKE